MNLEIKSSGIKNFQSFLDRAYDDAEKAASLSINTIARKVYADSKRKIMAQTNLKASYLDGRDGSEPRLKIVESAKPGRLRSTIRGRQRATSLARFDAKQLYGAGRKKTGVSVMVKRRRKNIPKAFLVNLKNGNTGLALRLKDGETIKNKHIQTEPLRSKGRKGDVFLLYGPSVEQVFRYAKPGGKSIAQEGIEYVETHIDREFQRQFARLTGG